MTALTPNACICNFNLTDRDGEISHEVRHTRAEEILLLEYGEIKVSLDYEQARALAWALVTICDIHEGPPSENGTSCKKLAQN